MITSNKITDRERVAFYKAIVIGNLGVVLFYVSSHRVGEWAVAACLSGMIAALGSVLFIIIHAVRMRLKYR